jgi:enterochelin esterase-like enzyme
MRDICPGILMTLLVALSPFVAHAQDAPMTPKAIQTEMSKNLSDADASKLADKIRSAAGQQDLAQGIRPLYEEGALAFAIVAMEAPQVETGIGTTGTITVPLHRLGQSNLYATVINTPEGEPGFPKGIVVNWKYKVAGQERGKGNMEAYPPNPDTQVNPNVPHGKLTQQPNWKSKIFPDTDREWWVYVPAQYTPDKPACVMIFQDGSGYKEIVSTVFDNLIQPGNLLPGGVRHASGQRSFEYDTLSDQYARFLLEEILPEVEKTVKLKHDAASRAVAGLSSGGICAFTAAWERPTEFSKVLSWIGSFTNIASGPTVREGGHNYEALLRKTPPKPIRVFLQDGANDLDNNNGNWPLANQQMAKALAFAHYDYKFVFGYGGHSPNHGRAILPNSLRWLWRDYPR